MSNPLDKPRDIGEPYLGQRTDSWEWLRTHAAAGSYDAYIVAMELNSTSKALHEAWAALNRAGVEPPKTDVWGNPRD